MDLETRVKNNVVLWTLSMLAAGFLAGVSTYEAILRIAKLEVVSKLELEKYKGIQQELDSLKNTKAGEEKPVSTPEKVQQNQTDLGVQNPPIKPQPSPQTQEQILPTKNQSPYPGIPSLRLDVGITGKLADGAHDDYVFMGSENTPLRFTIQRKDGGFWYRAKILDSTKIQVGEHESSARLDEDFTFVPKSNGQHLIQLWGERNHGDYVIKVSLLKKN